MGRIGVLVVAAFALSGCAVGEGNDAGKIEFRQRNEGYSLLYKMMDDESQVEKLLIIKHADEPVKEVIKEISEFGAYSKKQLEEFAKSDRLLGFETPDLPAVEQKSRDIARSEDTKKLLFSSGAEFQLYLVYTQAEAMQYSSRLAAALAQTEKIPERKTFLEGMSKRSQVLAGNLMALMTVKF
jgi:hypothetical protein